MTPERWKEIEALYHRAQPLSPSERAAFLAKACCHDELLRREVESLLDETGSTHALVGGLENQTRPYETSTLSRGAMTEPGAAARLAPGQDFGPYRIVRLLGRGGMGEVYEAEQREHGRRLALKVLSQRLTDPSDRARFLREGQLAASVSHPHSVYVFGGEEIAGTPFIAMELLPGGTLKDRVHQEGPLPPSEAVDAILQIIAGLDAAQTV